MNRITRLLNMSRRPHTFAAVLIALSALVVGCNIVLPVAYIVEGPGTIDAQYTLPDRKTLVYIDDRANIVNPTTLRAIIAETTTQLLMEKAKITSTLNPRDAIALVSRSDRNSELLSIQDIGEMAGAEQIVYVEMYAFAPSPDGYTPQPYASCQVRVIDITNRTRLFPDPANQETPSVQVTARTPAVNPEVFNSRASALKAYQVLAVMTGEEIAKLFYEHERINLGERLEPR
jgi:hypothetical protein